MKRSRYIFTKKRSYISHSHRISIFEDILKNPISRGFKLKAPSLRSPPSEHRYKSAASIYVLYGYIFSPTFLLLHFRLNYPWNYDPVMNRATLIKIVWHFIHIFRLFSPFLVAILVPFVQFFNILFPVLSDFYYVLFVSDRRFLLFCFVHWIVCWLSPSFLML